MGKPSEMSDEIFECTAAWHDTYSDTMVIKCSDGRFAEPTDEFLRSIGVTHPDRFYLPGGPASMVKESASQELDLQKLAFLVEGHATKRIIALAHRGCGYYHTKYPRHKETERQQKQFEDLREFKQQADLRAPGVRVELYYIEKQQDNVTVLRIS